MLTDAQIVLLATVFLGGWAAGVMLTLALTWRRLFPARRGNGAVDARRTCTCEALQQAATMNTHLFSQNARLAMDNVQRLGRLRFGDALPIGRDRAGAARDRASS